MSIQKARNTISIFDIMETLIEQSIPGEEIKVEDYVLFKKEVNYTINKYTSFLDTSKVNFKSWYVCLFNFMQIYCKNTIQSRTISYKVEYDFLFSIGFR